MHNRASRGFSLLELMVTIALLTTVVVAFAAVYPAGYRLNRKSAKYTVAAQTAQAVLQEIENLPLTNNAGGLSLAFLADNPWTEGSSEPNYAKFPQTPIPNGYFLKSIKVTTYDLGTTDPTVFATIKVTVSYTDLRSKGKQDINVSVGAAKTINCR